MNRVIKTAAIAAATLGLTAMLSAPAMAQNDKASKPSEDPISALLGDLLGRPVGASVLDRALTPGGLGRLNNEPYLELSESNDEAQGPTQTEGPQRIGKATNSRSGGARMPMAGQVGPGNAVLLDGSDLLTARQADAVSHGFIASLSSLVEDALKSPTVEPVTRTALPEAADSVDELTESVDTLMDTTPGSPVSMSSKDLMAELADAVEHTLPGTEVGDLAPLAANVAPVESALTKGREPDVAGVGSIDEIAPLVEGAATYGDVTAPVEETLRSIDETTGALGVGR